MAVKDTDKGWKAMRARVAKSAGGNTLAVGILGDDVGKPHRPEEGEPASDITIGEIGEVHELGLGNNPVRSWLRGYVDGNSAQIEKKIDRIAQAVIKGTLTKEEGLNLLGLDIVGGIQKRISDGIMPQVTAKHQARKGAGKTTPLINSGQFRGSISHKVGT